MNNVTFLEGSPNFGDSYPAIIALHASILVVAYVAKKALNNLNYSFETSYRAAYAISGVVTFLSFLTIHHVSPLVPVPSPWIVVAHTIFWYIYPKIIHNTMKFIAFMGISSVSLRLGDIYERGNELFGIEVNPQRGIEYYAQAANQNNAVAQYELGWRYQNGTGVDVDLQRAVELYTRAANQNHAAAQNRLGICYDDGIGVEVDHQRAVELYTQAANQNYAAAQYNLGSCYQNGRGVAADPQRAVELYTQAANQNYASAQNNLGFCYEHGIGVEANRETAIAWYRRAADLNYENARTNLDRLVLA